MTNKHLQPKRVLRAALFVLLLSVVGMAKAQNIEFADANVKAICVANWDTYGDGELSYAEAAMVTNLGTVFRYNSNFGLRAGEITATANPNYNFVNWTKNGTVVSTNTSYTFTVNGSASYVANFEANPVCDVVFELNDSYGDGWTGNNLVVEANGTSQELTLYDGYSVTFNIQFATGDHVTLSWIEGSDLDECSFTVRYGHTGVVILEKPQSSFDSFFSYEFDVDCAAYTYDITATANPAEGGTVSGAGEYYKGQHCTLTATAEPGYAFLYWTKNGTPVSSQASYTFHVTEDATYVANFVDANTVCNVVFDLADSDGDGWTGNQLVVTSNGFSQYLTIEDGYTESYTIPFTKGTSVSLGWITGYFSGEYTFTVSYEGGEVFFESSGTFDSSFSHDFVVNCGGTDYHTLNVLGYGDGTGGWNLIASPVAGSIEAWAVGNIFAATEYDLYRFDQGEVKEWRNYKSVPFNLENGKGYLYATKEERTLAFVGPYNEADTQEVPLIYTTTNPSASMHGWNLIGNPFTTNATIGGRSFYRMNSEGSEIIPANSNEQNIAPMEGIFVHADTEGETVTFTRATRATGNSGEIVLNLFSNGVASTSPATTLMDRAIVRMGEGRALPKFQIKDNSDKLYIPQSGKDYAVVTIGRDVARNVFTEMPVNFEAAKNGTYTLSVNVENMDLEYLHLIDNLTGADVDLVPLLRGQGGLKHPATYTFTAKTTDYTSRFKLVFSTNDASTGSASDAPFAYISNGEIRLLVETCQSASLQVIDMTGRVIRVCTDIARNVSTDGMTAGVYVLRLIDCDSVRMQKIVVP